MKTRRKFVAFAMAAVSLFSLTPMGAGATDYDCDVNGDGAEDILDAIALNRYLLGLYYVGDPSAFDVNENLVVDYADTQCIMACVTRNDYSHRYIDDVNELISIWEG